MTFNIRYGTANDGANRWQNRRSHVFDVIRRYSPDIVGVQEALHFQLEELTKALPQYDAFGVGRDDGKQAGEYAAILYDRNRFERLDGDTFWLSDTPEVVCSTSWGNQLCRICTWAKFRDRNSGEVLYHFNVHLDHASAEARLRSIELVIDRINHRSPASNVILTGDFNAGENSPPIKAIRDARITLASEAAAESRVRLLDTFRIAHPDAKEVGTFDSWVGDRTGDKIDYIFVPENAMNVIDADIAHDDFDGAYASDHFPVWATLRLGKPSSAPAPRRRTTSR